MLFSVCNPYRLVCKKIQICSGKWCLWSVIFVLVPEIKPFRTGNKIYKNSISVKKPTYIPKVLQAF